MRSQTPHFQSKSKSKAFFLLTLTEVRGFGFAEINKLAPELSMEGEAFRLKMI